MKDLYHSNVGQLFCAWSEEQEGAEHEQGYIFLAQELCKWCVTKCFFQGIIQLILISLCYYIEM